MWTRFSSKQQVHLPALNVGNKACVIRSSNAVFCEAPSWALLYNAKEAISGCTCPHVLQTFTRSSIYVFT